MEGHGGSWRGCGLAAWPERRAPQAPPPFPQNLVSGPFTTGSWAGRPCAEVGVGQAACFGEKSVRPATEGVSVPPGTSRSGARPIRE